MDHNENDVYTYGDLIAKGITKKEISDCVRAGFMELGEGKLENGQLIKLVKITKRGHAVQRVHPNEMKEVKRP